MVLFLISIVVVYFNLAKFENVTLHSELIDPNVDSFKQDEILDPVTENVIEMMQHVDETLLLGYLEKLISFGPRPTAGRIQAKLFDLPIEKAAKYIYNEFQSMGLKVRYLSWEQKPTVRNLRVPKWSFGWFIGKNIEATLQGTNKSSDKIYVISAHLDSWPGSPGANDNGAGVAAILAIAKIMSQYSFDHTVRFLFTDGEEQGLFGCSAYVNKVIKNKENIIGSIFTEVLGFAETDYGSNYVKIVDTGSSSWISNYNKKICNKYYSYLNLKVIPIRETYYGDYLKFLEFGYDSVTIFSYENDNLIHTSDDTLDRLNISYLTKVTRLILATISEMVWNSEYE